MLGIIAVGCFVVVIVKAWPWYFPVGIFVVAFAFFGSVGAKENKQKIEARFSGRPVLNENEFATRYFPPDRAEIAIKLRKILANHIGIDLSRMKPTDRFVEDFRMEDMDSMSTVEYVIAIENEFGIEIPDSAAEKMATFQSVVDYVAEAVKSKAN